VSITQQILATLDLRGQVRDVCIGLYWTAVAIELADGTHGGLATTLGGGHDHHKGQPPVRLAGRLQQLDVPELAQLALSGSVVEASVGWATINALLNQAQPHYVEVNAADVLLEQGRGRRVAIVGHFPFLAQLKPRVKTLWVLELSPREGDLPAQQAPVILPQADVVGITGSSLVNGTFDTLVKLCRPDAYVVVLGASAPLTPLLFDRGVQAIAGTVVKDVESAMIAVGQGATFPQIPGRRLLTAFKQDRVRLPSRRR